MTAKSKQFPLQIVTLAQDLGLKGYDDPEVAIFEYCEKQIKDCFKENGPCGSFPDLLARIANKVGTTFRFVSCYEDLQKVKAEFVNLGEKAFANLDSDLSEGVYGITYRRLNCQPWELPFVSVIDCRDDKSPRSYFTQWHEIAHLLTLTDQFRLVFRRTHNSTDGLNHEERLMDRIAGCFGFYSGIFHQLVKGEISFEQIEKLRSTLCPEASHQAALINFAQYWPAPCILVRAELALNKREREKQTQGCFDFVQQPKPVLRAVKVAPNDEARHNRFLLYSNMRVPTNSVAYRVYADNLLYAENVESLAWWGSELPERPIKVKARLSSNAVEMLITPL